MVFDLIYVLGYGKWIKVFELKGLGSLPNEESNLNLLNEELF
jgi:hypothetical protein